MNMAGDPELENVVMSELKQSFRPEFLNRLDDMIIFNPLGEEEVVDIVGLFFQEIVAKVAERDITLELTDKAKTVIAEAGFDPVYGARPLKRALYEIVEDRLADLILSGEVSEGSKVVFDASDNEIVVNVS